MHGSHAAPFLALSLIAAACAGAKPDAQTGAVPATVVSALDAVCLDSESAAGASAALPGAAQEAGFALVDGRYVQGRVSVAPGGAGMQFCDVQVTGAALDHAPLFEALELWVRARATPMAPQGPIAPFANDTDRGMRAGWGTRPSLAAYVYANDRPDGRRARIMYDAI